MKRQSGIDGHWRLQLICFCNENMMLLNLTWRDFEVRFCKLRLLERRFSAFDVSTTFDHGYGHSAYQILRYLEIPVVDMYGMHLDHS